MQSPFSLSDQETIAPCQKTVLNLRSSLINDAPDVRVTFIQWFTSLYSMLHQFVKQDALSFNLAMNFVLYFVKMSYLGVGGSPGNVPVYHASNLQVIDKRLKLAELVLRCIICGLAILSAVLIGIDTQVKGFFTIRKKAKFTDMKALVFLVIANGIAAAYSLVQLLRCVVSLVRGSVLFSKPLAWVIFSGDQVMAYSTMAAVAASAQSAVFAKFGQTELQWMRTCTFYGKFCNQVGEGVASAVLMSLAMVILSAISAFSLFRLYGDNKDKNSGDW